MRPCEINYLRPMEDKGKTLEVIVLILSSACLLKGTISSDYHYDVHKAKIIMFPLYLLAESWHPVHHQGPNLPQPSLGRGQMS